MRARILGPILVTLAAMAGAAAAVNAGAPGSGPVTISADWAVDLRTVLAVGGVVLPATWWLSRRFQQIADDFAQITAQLEAGRQRFEQLEKWLGRLPCRTADECQKRKDETET